MNVCSNLTLAFLCIKFVKTDLFMMYIVYVFTGIQYS